MWTDVRKGDLHSGSYRKSSIGKESLETWSPDLEWTDTLTILESHGCGVVLLAQPCPTLCDPMGCSPPGSSVHGILQARMLEWVAMSSSRGSSQPRVRACISCIAGRFFTTEPLGKPSYSQIMYEIGMGVGLALSQLSANSQPKRGQNRNKREPREHHCVKGKQTRKRCGTGDWDETAILEKILLRDFLKNWSIVDTQYYISLWFE